MDNRQFPELRPTVRSLKDARVSVYAELVSHKNAPKSAGTEQWQPGYHARLYNLTDDAIRGNCI